MKVHPGNPVLFDFIVDSGDSGVGIDTQAFQEESRKLIKYFLAALTIKEKDMWVNLSPYEKDRMLSDDLGLTEMGQDMLAQDYLLKQLTASFMDPEKGLGRKFWDRVYSEARAEFGTIDIPVDTFNKVWIMADKAKVFERDGTAFVVASHLKVMLESDYLAMSNSPLPTGGHVASSANVSPSTLPSDLALDAKATQGADLSKSLIRQIILPAIEEEVNQGKNFAPLRQMFHSMILATWYKKALKDALLNEVYTDQGKTSGVAAQDPNAKEKIFEQYLAAYRTGAVNFIREEIDPQTGEMTPRKYFSGGVAGEIPLEMTEADDPETVAGLKPDGDEAQVRTELDFAEAPMKWMYVNKFTELVRSGKIAQGARIHIYMTLDKGRQYRIPDGIISNATFDSIGTDGRIFYYPGNSMPEASPNSLLASAISRIAVQGDFAEDAPSPEGVLPRVNPTTTQNWMKLKSFAAPGRFNLRQLFARDPGRIESLSIALNPEFEVDFSKNLIDGDVKEALIGLAREVGLPDAIEQMFRGEKINETENRAVLHSALRNIRRDAEGRLIAANGPVFVDGKDVMPKVIAVLEQIESFTHKVQSGEWRGASGKKIKNIINVGIGGSDLGPRMAVEALKPYKAGDLDAYFLSNIDGTAAAELMKKLDPEETIVIVVSKTFKTQETMQNAQTMRQWVLNAYQGDPQVIKDHFVAVSTEKDLVTGFGIDEKNMFEFWDWVGGRYSVWSAVGLSLAAYIGFDNFLQFLEGGREADEQFRTQPLEKNISALKGLIDVWNIDFLGAKTLAILPYDQYLGLYPAFTQQFYMESNGKSVDRNGEFVNYSTQPVIFGAAGTDGQHSFYEQLHQGTDLIPADFIGVINSHNDVPGHHEKFFSNFVAQTEALAFGATTEEVKAILSADPKYAGKDLDWNAMHQTFTGNKPTTSILIDKITPRTLGNLVAMYENEIFTAGIIWNIFSFDQWGVQLGKKVATDKVLPFLDGTRPFEDLSVAGLSSSATRMIRKFVQAHQVWAPLDADEYENGPADRAEDMSVTREDLLKRDPSLKVASDADQIRKWASPHGVSLEKVLNGVVKEYDIRGYDGGDDAKFPTQIDPVLWRWFGRALGSVSYTSERHGRTVSLQPGDFYLIAGDNGPSTGGQPGMVDRQGNPLPNVIEAVSNGFMDAGINVINLNIVGSGALYSTVAGLMDELKNAPEKFRQVLREGGLDLSDEQFAALQRVKGGVYITRSHVEVGTNGAKPNIDGITLYGDMLQGMKAYIRHGVYREAPPAARGRMFKNDWIRESAFGLYTRSIKDQFGDIKSLLDDVARIARQAGKPAPKVIVNFSGGSLAATERANKEKFYPGLFRELLGDHLKTVLRAEGDPWNENGGLADPTRPDEVALGNPKANIIQVSRDNPDDIIINFDLDADRVSVLQDGQLFLGDEMFYPVIEYQLTLDPYSDLHRTQIPIYFDSRMKSEFAAKVRKHGGIAKIHPKGHSKVKATIDVTFAKIVSEWAAANGKPATKEEFLAAHPGFKIVQAEYSTHMFMTDTRGNAFDDAVRFGFFWLQAFAKIQAAKGASTTIAEYIRADKEALTDPLPDSKQLKEQRTSVSYIDENGKIVPVSDEQKRNLIYRMTDKVKAYFEGRSDDFEHIPDWQRYEGNRKPFTLVEVEGVFHLFVNKPGIEGEIFWGWSNTSNKVAFGTQSADPAVNRKLAELAVALLVESRTEIAAETKLDWIKIEDTETKGLRDVFDGLNAAGIEAAVTQKFPEAVDALKAIDAAEKPEILEIKGVSRAELLQEILDMGPEDEFEAVKTGSTLWLDGAGLWSVKLTEDGVLKFNQGASGSLVFSAKVDPGLYAEEQSAWNVWKDIEQALMEAFRSSADKAQKPEILEIKGLSKEELLRKIEDFGPDEDFVVRKVGSVLNVGKGTNFWKVDLTPDGLLNFYYDNTDRLIFTARMDPAVYAGLERGWDAWDAVRGALLDAFTDTTDKASLNDIQGGIDLDGNAMGLDIEKSGKGVTMAFDPVMAARFRKGDFKGLTPVIIQVIPVTDPASLLGLSGSAPAVR